MHEIHFEAELYAINSWRLLRLPPSASKTLPSRGMVMVKGTMNGAYFEAALEPDGAGSHWFRVSDPLSASAHADVGDKAEVTVELIGVWPEPEVPEDFIEALTTAGLLNRWNEITTKARWEWIRWIRSTSVAETRQKRIQVACSKLQAGKNRPCCYDQSRCTETAVSKSGVLTVLG